jgi:protein-S-isoprenylcysteine O-methyltransferase Ste14
MPRNGKNEETGGVIGAIIFLGILLYAFVIQPAVTWISQNWVWILLGLVLFAVGVIAFYSKFWLPIETEVENKIKKDNDLKKKHN